MIIYENGVFDIYEIDIKEMKIKERWNYCSLVLSLDTYVAMNKIETISKEECKKIKEFGNEIMINSIVLKIENLNYITLSLLINKNKLLIYKIQRYKENIILEKVLIYKIINNR